MSDTLRLLARKMLQAIAIALAALLLTRCMAPEIDERSRVERLSTCQLKGTVFASLPFAQWAEHYHSTVKEVIDADVHALAAGTCTEADTSGEPSTTKELYDLASTLEPWKVPSRLSALSESDLGAVLLEFNRVYGCAMTDYKENIIPFNPSPLAEGDQAKSVEQNAMEGNIITRELATAPASLTRTLLALGTINRLRPLLASTGCLSRVSLDLRNEMGLIAEAMSCVGKFRNSRTSLRDLSDFLP